MRLERQQFSDHIILSGHYTLALLLLTQFLHQQLPVVLRFS